MKFRDTLTTDRDVFLSLDEFAENHNLDGNQGTAIVQQVSADNIYTMGSNIQTRKYFELYGSHAEVNCKEESLKEIPVSGQLFLLDQKPYQVTEVKNDLGIITLILVANDR